MNEASEKSIPTQFTHCCTYSDKYGRKSKKPRNKLILEMIYTLKNRKLQLNLYQ